jgi:hypothetical protein
MRSKKYKLRKFTPSGDRNFKLSKNQIAKLNDWLIGVEQRAAELQAANIITHNDELPYYGAIGGGLTFTFSPNGVGTYCKVTEAITGESIDLSEYDEW